MIDEYVGHVFSGPTRTVRNIDRDENCLCTYFHFHFLHIVIYTQLVSFCVRGNCMIRVPPHGYLMGLNESRLAILIQNTERVKLGCYTML